MYLPLTYAQANHPIQGAPGLSGGLGDFETISPALQLSEFYPPPYDFLAPRGMGGARGRGVQGLGLFDSMDFTTWGFPEWLTVGAVLYFGSKLFSDAQKVSRKVRGVRSRRARVRARKAKLKEEMESL